MSDTAWNWVALGATVVLFAGLAYLSIRKKAGFSVRVLIATVLGIVVGIAFKGHTDYVAAFGSVWSNAIAAIVVPLLLFSVIAAITNLGESLKLRNIGIKTVVFLLINTFTAALITLGLAPAVPRGRGLQVHAAHRLPAARGARCARHDCGAVPDEPRPELVFQSGRARGDLRDPRGRRLQLRRQDRQGRRGNVKPFKAFVDAGNVVLSKATQIVVGFTRTRCSR